MNTFIYRGKKLTLVEMSNSIEKLSKTLTDSTSIKSINYKTMLTSLNKFSEKIKSQSLLSKKIHENYSLNELANLLQEDIINKKIIKELNEYPGELININPSKNLFSGYIPMGIVGHFFFTNNIVTSFISIIDSIICGNINIILTEKNEYNIYYTLLTELINIDSRFSNFIYLFPIENIEKNELNKIINCCNIIETQGNEEKVNQIKALIPNDIKTISFNNKINLSYITKKGENKDTYKSLALDYFNNNSIVNNIPKIIYYECDTKKELLTFADKFVQAIKKCGNKGYKNTSNISTISLPLIDISKKNKTFIEIPNTSFKLILDTDSSLNSTTDLNTIIIKSIKRKDLSKVFNEYKNHLGTVALVASTEEIYKLTNFFSCNGVTKITSCGNIINDENSNIKNYVKKFSIDQSILPKGIYNFNELNTDSFNNKNEIPYKDIENNIANAFSLVASGLKSDSDLCANIIPNENLLNKFLINYNTLNLINAKQLFLQENKEPYYIAEQIINNNANVIIGSSSYIFKLLSSNKDWFKWYGKINKIFYYDHNFSSNELEFIKNEFNITTIKCVGYGNNENGILGISCPYCDNSTYHVNSVYNKLEILKFNEDKPVDKNEEGRLVWKYIDPKTNEIITHESGELGIWINIPCKCGRITPKFKIVGKKGDLFKINDIFINYNTIKKILKSKLNYNGLLQINLENIDNKTNMTILVEKNINIDDCYKYLYSDYPEYANVISKGYCDVIIIAMDASEFTYNNSASTLNVIDGR